MRLWEEETLEAISSPTPTPGHPGWLPHLSLPGSQEPLLPGLLAGDLGGGGLESWSAWSFLGSLFLLTPVSTPEECRAGPGGSLFYAEVWDLGRGLGR